MGHLDLHEQVVVARGPVRTRSFGAEVDPRVGRGSGQPLGNARPDREKRGVVLDWKLAELEVVSLVPSVNRERSLRRDLPVIRRRHLTSAIVNGVIAGLALRPSKDASLEERTMQRVE